MDKTIEEKIKLTEELVDKYLDSSCITKQNNESIFPMDSPQTKIVKSKKKILIDDEDENKENCGCVENSNLDEEIKEMLNTLEDEDLKEMNELLEELKSG